MTTAINIYAFMVCDITRENTFFENFDSQIFVITADSLRGICIRNAAE